MKSKSSSSSLNTLLLCLGVASFSSCAFLENPNTTAALNKVANGAIAYTSGNTIGAAVDGVQAAAYLIRSLQGTPQAANPAAVAAQATQAGAGPIASNVASAVSTLVQQGQTPDAANEAVARALDAATAKK